MKIALFALTTASFVLGGPLTESRPVFKVDAHLLITNSGPYQSTTDRLQQTLLPGYTRNVTEALNSHPSRFFSKPLVNSNANAANVLIISPTEYRALTAVGVTMQEIEDIGFNNYIAYTIYSLGCIGKYTDKKSGAEVAYIETKARTWDNMRRDIDGLYKRKGGRGGFVGLPWTPHIVIGETHPGLVVDDIGVGKGVCVADTSNEDPIGIGIMQKPNIPVDWI